MPRPDSLVELIQMHAETRGRNRSLCFLEPDADGRLVGEDRWWTYEDLHRKARTIAAALQAASRRGERALLLYPPGIEYVAAFLGCLYAGVVAVPIYPPDPMRLNRTLPRIQAVLKDAGASAVLTTELIFSMAEPVFEHAPEFRNLQWIATDVLAPEAASAWKDPGIGENDIAFLQYTSGSTGAPKGVVLTHNNLLANSRLIRRYMAIDENSFCVIWLPPYHDMGLIGGILQPLYTGYPCALLSPFDFLRKPLRWLDTITKMGGTVSGGPNFAYDLCVRKIKPEEREALDLSRWKTAFNGAEPIRRKTLERFADYFAPCGFRPEAMFPCYGLAEATLMVSGGPHFQKPVFATFESLHSDVVACGGQLEGQTFVIVDPETYRRCPDGRVGEIWVRGPSVAQGYWMRPEETEEHFRAFLKEPDEGPFLRTGDLGLIHEGQLFVTGRLKDLIVIRGANHYPHDIEMTVERADEAVRPGCTAAFSVDGRGEERLIVVAELERRFHPPTEAVREMRRENPATEAFTPKLDETPDPEAIQRRILAAVTGHHGVSPSEILLIKAGTIPKTSSGKIQRRACRHAFEKGGLEVLSRWKISDGSGEHP